MIGHYGRFGEIQSSLVMGDLEAARASPALVQSCGSCHEEVGANPNVRFVAGAPAGDSRADPISRSMWAVDQLMDGMVFGDNEYWMNGARALADDDNLSVLGKQVMAAMGDQRAVVYGWVLKGRADCHTR